MGHVPHGRKQRAVFALALGTPARFDHAQHGAARIAVRLVAPLDRVVEALFELLDFLPHRSTRLDDLAEVIGAHAEEFLLRTHGEPHAKHYDSLVVDIDYVDHMPPTYVENTRG